jgi:hypothetical protein
MKSLSIEDIAVTHTPPGGWTEWPGPILTGCEAPLVDGAPDLRGLWRTIEVLVEGCRSPSTAHSVTYNASSRPATDWLSRPAG